MTELEWKAPPAPARRKVDTVAAQLRTKPGEWACIQRRNPPLGGWWTDLNTSDEFEVQTRKSNPGDGVLFGPRDIYARYVGEALEAAP